jgi:hypothetical protein
MSSNTLKVEYPIVSLADLRVVPTSNPQATRRASDCLAVRGETFQTTGRFWRSLFHRFGISGNIFRYFDHDEVFTRVVQRSPDDTLRLCAERRGNRCPRLLAVSHPKRPLLDYDQAVSLLGRYHDGPGHDDHPTYHDGIVSSTHTPRSGQAGSDIGPDRFHNRFVVEAPIDGFGQPRIFLSLLRQVCSNGAIGYARAFRSDIRIGEDAVYTLDRALGQFDHEEGFAALRQRFQSAQKSWASLHEALQLHRVLARLGIAGAPYQRELDRLCGDLHALYGLANLESLSVKRQRMLPARCRVYDLLNFASEIATHRASAESRPRLQAYIGTLVSDEFDLEGTAEKVPEFKDLFLNLN